MSDSNGFFGIGGDQGQQNGFGPGFGGNFGHHHHQQHDHHHHHHHHHICFMADTGVRIPAGEIAVQDLNIGDLVCTADGRRIPVRWVGRQTVAGVFCEERQLPVRVKAGAIGDRAPFRDLLVSPGHALLVDGVLIQAAALVNGTSILHERNIPAIFTYYHVEVDDHSLIFAEGTPAETFIDNVDRGRFDNWSEYQALYPEGKTIAEMAYPRAMACRQVPWRIRERLVQRGAALYGAQIASAA